MPRSLYASGNLAYLVTDAWVPPGSVRSLIGRAAGRRLAQRYHPDLQSADVRSLDRSLATHEVSWRLQGYRGWDLLIARNDWFQRQAVEVVSDLDTDDVTTIFAHSYSARHIFELASERGWMTVLGQIDPGPEHFRIQQQLAAEHPEFGPAPSLPPEDYFKAWRRECELATRIVVNSEWSRLALLRAGVPAEKLTVIALPYEAELAARDFTRTYPRAFSAERPLRALFVGTASVTKGVGDLLGALERLPHLPIELELVGGRAMDVPSRFAADPRIHWIGPVDRATVMQYYRSNDVLVFPSHSDGFGMAQIEAQGWRLPIIASEHCGRVVRDGETGIVLSEVTPESISATLERVAGSPEMLQRFSDHAAVNPAATLAALGSGLAHLAAA